MSPRPLDLLAYIKRYRAEHGYSPDTLEIVAELGLTSTSVARYWLVILAEQGLITHTPRVPRAYVPTDERRFSLPADTHLPALVAALCEQIEREDQRGAAGTARALRALAKLAQALYDAQVQPIRAWLEEAYGKG